MQFGTLYLSVSVPGTKRTVPSVFNSKGTVLFGGQGVELVTFRHLFNRGSNFCQKIIHQLT